MFIRILFSFFGILARTIGQKHADLIGREGTGEQVGGTGTQARCST
jgi:hypothetical protein